VHWHMCDMVTCVAVYCRVRALVYSSCPGFSNMSKMMTTVEMTPHTLCWFCFRERARSEEGGPGRRTCRQ